MKLSTIALQGGPDFAITVARGEHLDSFLSKPELNRYGFGLFLRWRSVFEVRYRMLTGLGARQVGSHQAAAEASAEVRRAGGQILEIVDLLTNRSVAVAELAGESHRNQLVKPPGK